MRQEEAVNRVFVYGTLKEGHALDRPAFSEKRLASDEAIVGGDLFDLGWFPGVKLSGNGKVYGEVHTYPEKEMPDLLATLDSIEGCNHKDPDKGLYRRVLVDVKLKTGEVVKAWIYEKNGIMSPERKIEGGVWLAKD
jgi:gamma-glutamylcyclotransferase (GGCT)/AIG2-like uncharacterized protein YtfP